MIIGNNLPSSKVWGIILSCIENKMVCKCAFRSGLQINRMRTRSRDSKKKKDSSEEIEESVDTERKEEQEEEKKGEESKDQPLKKKTRYSLLHVSNNYLAAC